MYHVAPTGMFAGTQTVQFTAMKTDSSLWPLTESYRWSLTSGTRSRASHRVRNMRYLRKNKQKFSGYRRYKCLTRL